MAITAIEDIDVSLITAGTVNGDGVFDVMMKAVVAHLEVEYKNKRINSDVYPNVYLGALQSTLQQAVLFATQIPEVERKAALLEQQLKTEAQQTDLVKANKDKQLYENANLLPATKTKLEKDTLETLAKTALIDQQKLTEVQQTANATYNNTTLNPDEHDIKVAQKALLGSQKISEDKKADLIVRQTAGFTDDAKQKLLKQSLDSWAVAYSVAKDANSIPDSIKVDAIDTLMKSAMTGIGITTVQNNPLGIS